MGTMSSAFGFRNCKPLGRDEKKAMNDKESIEKQRLRERREEFFHFEEPNAGVGSVGWIPEADRFNTDSAHMEKQEQAGRREDEERFWDARRDANVRGKDGVPRGPSDGNRRELQGESIA